MASKYRDDSMYRVTNIIGKKYLGIFNPPVSDISSYNTQQITVSMKYDNRPDLLAYDLYGNPKLWWVFPMFNQDILIDPIIDFKSGITISVPRKFV